MNENKEKMSFKQFLLDDIIGLNYSCFIITMLIVVNGIIPIIYIHKKNVFIETLIAMLFVNIAIFVFGYFKLKIFYKHHLGFLMEYDKMEKEFHEYHKKLKEVEIGLNEWNKYIHEKQNTHKESILHVDNAKHTIENYYNNLERTTTKINVSNLNENEINIEILKILAALYGLNNVNTK